jgi:hypothetical protein
MLRLKIPERTVLNYDWRLPGTHYRNFILIDHFIKWHIDITMGVTPFSLLWRHFELSRYFNTGRFRFHRCCTGFQYCFEWITFTRDLNMIIPSLCYHYFIIQIKVPLTKYNF